jgi:uncharacterized protein (TIGR02118 family)
MSVFYPKTEGETFDLDYYVNLHIPMAVKAWGLDGAEIDKGIDGPYMAAAHFLFDSMDAMGAAMKVPEMGEIAADVTNYTGIKAVMQISEIQD